MSSHFSSAANIEKKTSLKHFFSFDREHGAAEKRFWKHGCLRGVVFLVGCMYFVYCNPEYSHTYSYFRRKMNWYPDDPPLLPQLLKVDVRRQS